MLPTAGAPTGPDVPTRIGALADLDHLVRESETVELAGLRLRLRPAGKIAVTDHVGGGFAGLSGHPDLVTLRTQLLRDLHRAPERRRLGRADDRWLGTDHRGLGESRLA